MIQPIYLYGSEVLRKVAAPADLSDKASLDGCPAGACGIVMSRFPCRTGKAGPLVRIPA